MAPSEWEMPHQTCTEGVEGFCGAFQRTKHSKAQKFAAKPSNFHFAPAPRRSEQQQELQGGAAEILIQADKVSSAPESLQHPAIFLFPDFTAQGSTGAIPLQQAQLNHVLS